MSLRNVQLVVSADAAVSCEGLVSWAGRPPADTQSIWTAILTSSPQSASTRSNTTAHLVLMPTVYFAIFLVCVVPHKVGKQMCIVKSSIRPFNIFWKTRRALRSPHRPRQSDNHHLSTLRVETVHCTSQYRGVDRLSGLPYGKQF